MEIKEQKTGTYAWFSSLSSKLWLWPVSLQHEVESWRPFSFCFLQINKKKKKSTQQPGVSPVRVLLVTHFQFPHMHSEPCHRSHLIQQIATWLLEKEIKRIHWTLFWISNSLSLWLLTFTQAPFICVIFTHTHARTHTNKVRDSLIQCMCI